MKRSVCVLLSPVAGLAAAVVALAVQLARSRSRASSRSPPTPARSRSRVVAEGRLVTYPGRRSAGRDRGRRHDRRAAGGGEADGEEGASSSPSCAPTIGAPSSPRPAPARAAEAEVRLATYESGRAEDLLAKQVDTASRRDRAPRDLEVATARRDSAKAAIVRFDAEIAKRRIVAPIDGVVLMRPVDPGETVEARAPILTLADLSRVRIEAEVDEFDTSRVLLGAEVSITAEGFDDARWRGEVEEIPDAVSGRRLKPQDPGKPSDTRVLLVKVKLAEPTPLKLGQRVLVEISPGRT